MPPLTGHALELKQRITRAMPPVYGACNIFDGNCTDNPALSRLANQNISKILALFPPTATAVYRRQSKYLTHLFNDAVDPHQERCSTDAPTPDIGICNVVCEGFGHLMQGGPRRYSTDERLYTSDYTQRRYVDGSIIANNRDFDRQVAAELLVAAWTADIINGAGAPNQMTGIAQTLTNAMLLDGNCALLKPSVVDWVGLPMNDTVSIGKTRNGDPIAATAQIIDVLEARLAEIKKLISQTPALRGQRLQYGDIVLLMPAALMECLKNHFLCFKPCGVTTISTEYSAQKEIFYQSNFGGDAEITINGTAIPIFTDEGVTAGDMFLLVRRVGNIEIWQHEYKDYLQTASPEIVNGNTFENGKFVETLKHDNGSVCYNIILRVEPRLCLVAPQLQTWIQNVACTSTLPVLPPVDPEPLDCPPVV